jgi:hypothetical protein
MNRTCGRRQSVLERPSKRSALAGKRPTGKTLIAKDRRPSLPTEVGAKDAPVCVPVAEGLKLRVAVEVGCVGTDVTEGLVDEMFR